MYDLQVTCNSRSSFLAAADDSGEVKVCLIFIHVLRSNFSLCNTIFIVLYKYIFVHFQCVRDLKAIHELDLRLYSISF